MGHPGHDAQEFQPGHIAQIVIQQNQMNVGAPPQHLESRSGAVGHNNVVVEELTDGLFHQRAGRGAVIHNQNDAGIHIRVHFPRHSHAALPLKL